MISNSSTVCVWVWKFELPSLNFNVQTLKFKVWIPTWDSQVSCSPSPSDSRHWTVNRLCMTQWIRQRPFCPKKGPFSGRLNGCSLLQTIRESLIEMRLWSSDEIYGLHSVGYKVQRWLPRKNLSFLLVSCSDSMSHTRIATWPSWHKFKQLNRNGV